MTTRRDSKAAYTPKQKRKAEHIEAGYEARGVPEDEAERRAWATVNKQDGGGKARRPRAGSRTTASSRGKTVRRTRRPSGPRR